MSPRTLQLNDALYEYLLDVSLREPDVLQCLREETAEFPEARMQISPEQGQFLGLLVKLLGARRTLEIGVFTGYSSLAVALALPEHGKMVACDHSEKWTDIARRWWQKAGVSGRIDLRIGTARETLETMIESKDELEQYDFAFIDADKSNYINYYEAVLQLLRPGGLVAVDNVLWGGDVADPENREEDTVAIRKFNRRLHDDDRIDLSLVPIGDGLTLARKR